MDVENKESMNLLYERQAVLQGSQAANSPRTRKFSNSAPLSNCLLSSKCGLSGVGMSVRRCAAISGSKIYLQLCIKFYGTIKEHIKPKMVVHQAKATEK